MSDVKTYVAGHKSPDTDSICSAISFANFLDVYKRQVSKSNKNIKIKRSSHDGSIFLCDIC